MVGPCAWDPPADPPPWLDDVRRPLVLVSTSSEFQDDGRLARTALEALAGEDVEVVATLPSAQLPESVPDNARVERFVPHGPILARAACAITHGGAGATQKALAAGVPVCVVPFGRDQLEIARRVEVAGAGTRLPARRLSAARLRSAVRVATTKHDGARRVAEGYRATGGAATAADAFESLAIAWPPRAAAAATAREAGCRATTRAPQPRVRVANQSRARRIGSAWPMSHGYAPAVSIKL
jgi:MGT family glycosyltransferase